MRGSGRTPGLRKTHLTIQSSASEEEMDVEVTRQESISTGMKEASISAGITHQGPATPAIGKGRIGSRNIFHTYWVTWVHKAIGVLPGLCLISFPSL